MGRQLRSQPCGGVRSINAVSPMDPTSLKSAVSSTPFPQITLGNPSEAQGNQPERLSKPWATGHPARVYGEIWNETSLQCIGLETCPLELHLVHIIMGVDHAQVDISLLRPRVCAFHIQPDAANVSRLPRLPLNITVHEPEYAPATEFRSDV